MKELKPQFYARCITTKPIDTKLKPSSIQYWHKKNYIEQFISKGKIYPAILFSKDIFKYIQLLEMNSKQRPLNSRQKSTKMLDGVFLRKRFKLIPLEENENGTN